MLNRQKTYEAIKQLGYIPSVIVDCGACVGEWSAMIRHVYPESFVLGIDASNWTQQNIPGTNATEIITLSDKDDKMMTFYRKVENLERGTFCTGDSLFKENSQHYKAHNTISDTVTTKTLKTVISKYKDRIDLLKIDTQGSELLILQGLDDMLQSVKFIELECSITETNFNGCMLYDVISFLKESFDIFDIVELHRNPNYNLFQLDIIFKNKQLLLPFISI